MPYVERGVPVVGLEPSCLLTLRDEFHSLLPGPDAARLADNALLFEEFLERECAAERAVLELESLAGKRVLLHGHCHQKAFNAVSDVERLLKRIPDAQVETIASTCCGMAGAFGYQAENYDTSMAIGELGVLPAVRKAGDDVYLVADGTSCRHQIRDGAAREAEHVAVLLARQLKRQAAA